MPVRIVKFLQNSSRASSFWRCRRNVCSRSANASADTGCSRKAKAGSPHGHARVSKLKHYKPPHGFADAIIFTDSVALFNELWEEWLNTKLYLMVKDAPLLEKDIKALLGSL